MRGTKCGVAQKIYEFHYIDKELLEFFLAERLLATETKFQEFSQKLHIINF